MVKGATIIESLLALLLTGLMLTMFTIVYLNVMSTGGVEHRVRAIEILDSLSNEFVWIQGRIDKKQKIDQFEVRKEVEVEHDGQRSLIQTKLTVLGPSGETLSEKKYLNFED